jgi:hypothetical protein
MPVPDNKVLYDEIKSLRGFPGSDAGREVIATLVLYAYADGKISFKEAAIIVADLVKTPTYKNLIDTAWEYVEFSKLGARRQSRSSGAGGNSL